MNKRRWITIGVFLVILVFGTLGYGAFSRVQAQSETSSEYQTEILARGELVAFVGATGTVRSDQSATLTWKTSGQVEELLVALGEEVPEGQVLATLAQTSLPQNVILAEADLVNSQQALDDLLNSQLPQAQALQAVEDAQQALDDLIVNFGTQQAQAQLNLSNARDNLEDTEYKWQVQQKGYRASSETIQAAEANLVLAEKEVDRAQSEFNKVSGRDDDDPARALALSNLSAAKQHRDSVLRGLNWYTGEPTTTDQSLLDAEVALAQAQYAEAEAAVLELQDGPTEAEVSLLEAQLADALREWERLKDGVNPDDIAAAEARLAAAQATLDQARITTPFSGVITSVDVQTGDQVVPNLVAFRLDDLSRLLVEVDVSEVDINQIAIGQDVTLTFDALLGKEYHGQVVEVAPVGIVQQGVVNFTVSVLLLDADENVRPGMTAAVNVGVSQIEDALLVPNRAVRTVDDDRVVYILDSDGSLRPVAITLGATSDTYSEVLGGELLPGDRIVLNPPAELPIGPGSGGGVGQQVFGGGG